MKRRSWKELASRITGISVSGIGSVSWVPSPNERKICEEVVTYLEDQGIFHSPRKWEHPKETYSAAASVRSELTIYMKKLNRDMSSFALGLASSPIAGATRCLARMTLIEITPHRWGWKAFEAPGVEPVFPIKDDAISYAEARARFRECQHKVNMRSSRLTRHATFHR